MVNTEIRKLEMSLISLCNKSSAPLEAKRLVFLEVLHKLEEASQKAISLELEESKKNEEGKTDE